LAWLLEIRKYQLEKGDIVVAMDCSLVGKSFAQIGESDLPALLLQRVARIRCESADINYLKELVCSELFTAFCDSVKTVTAIPHISPANIWNFLVELPSTIEEQSRIATILSDMDAEISAWRASSPNTNR
jgi:type I restriction enzyme S subunit